MEMIVVLLITAGALAAVVLPVIRGGKSRTGAPRPAGFDDAAIDLEVTRFREALRAGTICARCFFPNPAGSLYCADCGRPVAPPATTAERPS